MDQAAWAPDQPQLSLSKPQLARLIVRQVFPTPDPAPFGSHAGWSLQSTPCLQPGREILDLNGSPGTPVIPL